MKHYWLQYAFAYWPFGLDVQHLNKLAFNYSLSWFPDVGVHRPFINFNETCFIPILFVLNVFRLLIEFSLIGQTYIIGLWVEIFFNIFQNFTYFSVKNNTLMVDFFFLSCDLLWLLFFNLFNCLLFTLTDVDLLRFTFFLIIFYKSCLFL